MDRVLAFLIGDRHFIERNVVLRILLHIVYSLILLIAIAASIVDQFDEQPYMPLIAAAVFYIVIYRYLLRVRIITMVLLLAIQWVLIYYVVYIIDSFFLLSNRMFLLAALNVAFTEGCYWLRKKYDA